MESKTKHRILGIIVMAALVIALLPLFHTGNNDVKSDPQLTNAPPFPDQSVQASDNSNNPEFKVALANQVSPIPFAKSPESDNGFNQTPDDTINTSTSKAYNNVSKVAPSTPAEAAPSDRMPVPDLGVEDGDATTSKKAAGAEAKTAVDGPKVDGEENTESFFRNSLESEIKSEPSSVTTKVTQKTRAHEPSRAKIKQAQLRKNSHKIDNNGLFRLKNSAWVIQLGSYKNKTAALQLVNRLRANGYNAFIQQASNGTSVYVGPESKQEIARSLANRIEYEMKVQGFVISYKPLTL